MKSIILVALLFSSCFASSLYEQLSAGTKISKRDDAITCSTINSNCVNLGGSCSAGCPDCVNAALECQLAAENATALCACANTLINCFAAAKDATCDSALYHDSCLAQFSNCSCGTPYTGALTAYTCYSNAYCTDAGKCASVKAVGSACNSSSECGDVNADPAWTYDYYCTKNGVCAKANGNLPGDSCSVDSDCEMYASDNLGCVSGKCASQAVGQACPSSDSNVYCGPGLYCDDSDTCQKVIAIGASCDGNSTSNSLNTMCGLLGGCDSMENKCVAYLSKTKGQACSMDGECAIGLYCSQNKSTCETNLAEIACSTDSDCTKANPDYQGCSCVGGKAMCVVPGTSDCVNEALALYTCIGNNNCPEDFIPGGCVQNNCRKEHDCYFACFSNVLAQTYGGSACLSNYDNTCDTPSFAVKNVAGFAFVVLAAVAALL